MTTMRKLSAAARRALWPRGLGGRTVLVLSAAVVLVHLCTVLLYRDDVSSQADAVFANQAAGRLATAARAVMEADPARRDARAHALSSPGLDLHWGDHATVESAPSGVAALPGFRRRLTELAPDMGEVSLQFGSAGSADAPAVLDGSVRLPDGSYLNFGSTLLGPASPWMAHATLLSTTLMAAGVVAVAALLMRGLTRPLRRLAFAADAIGRGPEVAVAETGPDEVRQVARAFNGMQRRIHRLVEDRTQALAAVSHDLRTPITRLRLRAGFVPDPDMQAAIDADLNEMEGMIESTLAYLRGESEAEPKQVTDLAVLLSTLVDDATDAGAAASYHGPNHAALALHASSAKRAFANLVSNAVTYGGNARVTLAVEGGGVRVTVEDDGPGILDADLERVFQPFQRLDRSRSRATGGVGLGLAIARRAIENEDGRLRLCNREGGGLCAEVHLPPGDGNTAAAKSLAVIPTALALIFLMTADGRAACPAARRVVVRASIESAEIAIRTDYTAVDLARMAGAVAQDPRHEVLGFYGESTGFRAHISSVGDGGCRDIAVDIQLVAARRVIELASDLKADRCLFQAALKHYRHHSELQGQALARSARDLAPALHQAVAGSLVAAGQGEPATVHSLRSKVNAFVGRWLDDYRQTLPALRDEADSPAEIRAFREACSV